MLNNQSADCVGSTVNESFYRNIEQTLPYDSWQAPSSAQATWSSHTTSQYLIKWL